MLHPRFLTDRYRLIRSFLVGSLVYLASIQFLSFKESFTLSVTCALVWDFVQLFRHTWLLTIEQTRSIFTRWESNESFVAVRTIALVFMSIGILSFCISDLQHSSSVLPKSIHTLTTFFALFLSWLQLHNGFAIYYAKSYFERNRLLFRREKVSRHLFLRGKNLVLAISFMCLTGRFNLFDDRLQP